MSSRHETYINNDKECPCNNCFEQENEYIFDACKRHCRTYKKWLKNNNLKKVKIKVYYSEVTTNQHGRKPYFRRK